MSTIPAGVRSASIGVVSGVGGAGAGVALSAPCPFLCSFEPQPAASATSAGLDAEREGSNDADGANELHASSPSESRRILPAGGHPEPDKYCRSAK